MKIGAGETFHGEGVLGSQRHSSKMAWGYIAEFQGLPISRLKDVLADSQEILYELGIHFEAIASEAIAAHFLAINKNGAIFPRFSKQQPVE